MTRVLTISDPNDMPFHILERWPHVDQSVDSVSISAKVTVLIPHANVLSGEEDPLTHVMSEANRVLIPGGTLEFVAPYFLCPHGIGHPFQQRLYNEAGFYAFGCPHTQEDTTVTTKDDETGKVVTKNKETEIDPNKHSWGWWHGTVFPVKMRVMSLKHDETEWTVFYQRFNEGEYDG